MLNENTTVAIVLLAEGEVSAGIYCLQPFSLTDGKEVKVGKATGHIFLL